MKMNSADMPGMARGICSGVNDLTVSDTGPFLRQEGRNPAVPRARAPGGRMPGRLGMAARRVLVEHPSYGDGPVAFAWVARLASSMRRGL